MIMRNVLSGLLACAVLVFVVMGCGGGEPVAAKYHGNWVGDDGTTLYMNSDGKAGFKKGGKKVTGGGAEIDENAKTLTISLFAELSFPRFFSTCFLSRPPDSHFEYLRKAESVSNHHAS